MVKSWKLFGEAKRRWVPTQEGDFSHAGGTTSGLCPSGALPPPCASAIGTPSSLSSTEARPSHLGRASSGVRSDHSLGTTFISE